MKLVLYLYKDNKENKRLTIITLYIEYDFK